MNSEMNQVVKLFDRMFNILEKMMDFQKQIMDRQAIHIKLIRNNENKITINSDGINIEDKNGNIVTLASSGINLEDKNGNKVEMASGGIKVEASANVDVKGTNITVDGSVVTITGGMATVDGNAVPTPGMGGWCAVPNCIFSGSPHTGKTMMGT